MGSQKRCFSMACQVFLLAISVLPGLAAAQSETWPARPINIVVPQAAGGANDVVARTFAAKLATLLGQPVTVENRPGAGGNVGTIAVARAAKDGYTLMLTAQSSQTINPALYKKPGFDAVKDFEPIMTVATAPYVMVANPSFEPKTLKDIIAYAKTRPGKVDYASAGNGTLNHLLGVMLNKAAGTFIVHIPYRGASAAATDVVGGQIPMTFGSLPGVMPFVRAGQLRIVGVATEKPTRLLPGTPTLAETLPGLHVNSWYALFAPAGTPKEIVRKLQEAGNKILAAPDVQERLAGAGAEVFPGTPEQLDQLVKSELTRWAKIVKDSGAQLD